MFLGMLAASSGVWPTRRGADRRLGQGGRGGQEGRQGRGLHRLDRLAVPQDGLQGLRKEIRHPGRAAGGARQRGARERAGRAVGRPLPGRHPSQRQHDDLADDARRQLPAARRHPQHQEHRAALRGRRHPHPGRGDQLLPDDQPQPGEAGRRAQELEGHPRSQMGRQDPVRRLSRAGRRRGVLRGHVRTFGKEFHEKLAAQKPVFSRDIQNSERRVARGEFPLYIPFSLQDYNNLKGLPVKPIVPSRRPALCPLRPDGAQECAARQRRARCS